MNYHEELENFLQVMGDEAGIPSYFKEEFLDYKRANSPCKKKVGILGDPFYCLYVRAYGLQPVLLTGGSYLTGELSEMFPQISDPIAKSAIGLLLDPEQNYKEELAAVLVVAINDSYKKAIGYLKGMGVNVIQVEPIPYIREGVPFALYRQQLLALNDISKLVFGLFQESVFAKELRAYQQAYDIIAQDRFQALPGLVQAFFTHVLHNAYDKSQWCMEMESYLEGKSSEILPTEVILMGSHIHLPNYKIFKVFEDIGIKHFKNYCSPFPKYEEMDFSGGAMGLLKHCFAFQHKNAFVPGTVSQIERVELPDDTRGIVFYLLKGETSEAYMADRMEEIAIAQGVPFICVETDYTYTDLEQTKIRVEAFYEMLSALDKKAMAL